MLAIALVLLIVAAFWPAVRGDFLWDDDSHITANPVIIGPQGLKEIWTTSAANYFPLVLTNFWVQHALWGVHPFGYHLVTLLCHALAALVLWRVLLHLRVPGAWFGAALWAVHPVQVESVAWICELKNTQSAVFFLLAILFWLTWLDSSRERQQVEGRPLAHARGYALTLFFTVLALLSKPSTVMLPVALALVAWWQRGRLERRVVVALIPFFAMSAAWSAWTIWEQKFHSGAVGPEWNQSLAERVIIAGRVVWFYLGKLLWPEPLMFIYPRWQIEATHLPAYGATAAVLVTLAVLTWKRATWRPWFVAALFFGALLCPVLGFFNVYFFRYSFVGDHFQYLASIGPLVLLAGTLTVVARRWAPWVAGGILVVAGLLTARQSRVYLNNETLWRDTIAHNPGTSMPWVNLGATLTKLGRRDEALACYRQAMKVNPADPDPYTNLGNDLVLSGQLAEAVPWFERALALQPAKAEAHNNLGYALRGLGRIDEAMAHYREALRLQPRYSDALNNLGIALTESGRPAEALPHFEAALRLSSKEAGTHHNYANALRLLGRLPAAFEQYEQALRVADLAETHEDYAVALIAAGRKADAKQHLERAVQLKPALASARVQLGRVLGEEGKLADAMTHLEHAVKIDPKLVAAHLNLGAALSGLNRWPEAAAEFARAVELQPDSAEAHQKLALALANTGRLPDAQRELETALRLAPNSAETHTYLGQVLRALGREAEAAEHLARAAALQVAPR
ncbi:MAG TPA: tetratricopeptide repeat protein [Opitutaceae bacterium]|nr:tetratricopeptide repeat protein [Opitutaceae bacterium]